MAKKERFGLDELALEKLADELLPLLDELGGVDGRGPDGQLRSVLLLLSDKLIERRLASLAEKEGKTASCSCGAVCKRHQRRKRKVLTVGGEVHFTRSEYRCEVCKWSFAPLDEKLGLVGGSRCTAALRELMAFVQAEEPIEVTSQTLGHLLGFPVAPSVVNRAVQVEGARAEKALADQEAEVGVRTGHTVLVEVDGCHVPERDGWHEVKTGVVTDASCRVVKPPSAGEMKRAAAQHREPRGREMLCRKAYLVSRHSLEEFKDRVWDEAERWQVGQASRIALVGDGAAWIWSMGDELFRFPAEENRQAPELIPIVDWYHATEHLWSAAELIFGKRSRKEARKWVKDRETRLWEKGDAVGAARVIDRRAGRLRGERRKSLLGQAEYFRKNAKRMRYPWYREQGLPVGSGPVEGACKTVVQARCKRAGMRWNPTGLSRILALRTFRLNNRWQQLWPHAA